MSASPYVPPFTIGAVFNAGFGILFGHIGEILLASILVHVPLLLYYLLADPRDLLAFANTALVVFGIDFVLSLILAGAISALVVGALRGDRIGLGTAIAAGMRKILPILGVTIMLAVIIGAPAFVIGFFGAAMGQATFILAVVIAAILALMLLSRFWVAVPSVVMNHDGPIEAMTTSAALTRGRRGAIIGVLIIIAVINAGIGFLWQKIAEGSVTSYEGVRAVMLTGLGVGIVVGMIGPVMAAAGFHLLSPPPPEPITNAGSALGAGAATDRWRRY